MCCTQICIYFTFNCSCWLKAKGKGFPYSIPSVGPGADPGVQAVSPQVTVGHPPGGRLPLLSARPAVTSPAAEHHRPLAGTKLYCLVTRAHRCEQHAQGCYAALPRVGFEPTTYWSQVQGPTIALLRHLQERWFLFVCPSVCNVVCLCLYCTHSSKSVVLEL